MDNDLVKALPLLIPIIGIVMGVGLAMLAVLTDHQRKREMFDLHHKERLLAIERGMEVPPLPPEFFQRGHGRWQESPGGRLRRGLIWLFVGVALMAALALNRSLEAAAWGLIPSAVGLANLIYYFTVGRNQPVGAEVNFEFGPPNNAANQNK
ncbi:MAG: hypothetical protein HY066_13135 [Betaproteobacteria bacterium]|nr:hypothetical protein [Betaproteobacteria bacterium]